VPLSTHAVGSKHVAEDDDQGKDADENREDIFSGLRCKIVVQFEKHMDFYNAQKVSCRRSLQRVGTWFCLRTVRLMF